MVPQTTFNSRHRPINCKTHKLSLAYVPLPGLVATSIVAVLQGPDGKGNTCIPHEPATTNHMNTLQ